MNSTQKLSRPKAVSLKKPYKIDTLLIILTEREIYREWKFERQSNREMSKERDITGNTAEIFKW